MLTLNDNDLRAVQVAGTAWLKVRQGTLRPAVVAIAQEPTSVLVFVNDEDGTEVTVPRHIITAYDGELRDPELERRQAAIDADRARRAEEQRAGLAPIELRNGQSVRFKRPDEIQSTYFVELATAALTIGGTAERRTACRQLLEMVLVGGSQAVVALDDGNRDLLAEQAPGLVERWLTVLRAQLAEQAAATPANGAKRR